MGESLHNLNISGVTRASGGRYQDVRIQGIGKIHGDMECVTCRVEGVGDIRGALSAKRIEIQGKSTIKGNVASEEIDIEGQVTIGGDCEAEMFRANGSFHIDGLLNAGEVDIHLYAAAKAKEIGGEHIRVRKGYGLGLFVRKRLIAETIEGDDIHLENTKAKVVRGKHVTIGPGCEIDSVEYQVDFQQDTGAKVLNHKKI